MYMCLDLFRVYSEYLTLVILARVDFVEIFKPPARSRDDELSDSTNYRSFPSVIARVEYSEPIF